MYFLYFHKVNPSGNMTILLEDKNFSRAQKCVLAKEALRLEHLHGEQLGFINTQNGTLDMAGGEFCINATRALGLVMALNAGFNHNHSNWQAMLTVSGASSPIALDITHSSSISKSYDVVAHLPFSTSQRMDTMANGLVLVHMEGIKHLLINAQLYPFSKDNWQTAVEKIRYDLGLEHEPALGFIWWSFAESEPGCESTNSTNMKVLRIDPVVRIAAPFTECYENACGSGSVAIALWLYEQSGENSFFIEQPGGYLTVSISKDEEFIVSVGGPVSLVAKGEAFFDEF